MNTRLNFANAQRETLPPMNIQVAGGELFFDQINEFLRNVHSQQVLQLLPKYLPHNSMFFKPSHLNLTIPTER